MVTNENLEIELYNIAEVLRDIRNEMRIQSHLTQEHLDLWRGWLAANSNPQIEDTEPEETP